MGSMLSFINSGKKKIQVNVKVLQTYKVNILIEM